MATEKLGTEESIARVYQFLSKHSDWQQKADANGDGVINQTEFRGYMLSNGSEIWNGEQKYDANDIITKFWKSIDVNTRGKTTRGTSNANHLDNNEIANMEKNLQITKAIRDYVSDNSKVTLPDGLDAKYQDRFIESLKASLLNKATAYFASKEYDESKNTEFIFLLLKIDA